MMLFSFLDYPCQDDNHFRIIKDQVEKNFSIEDERNIVCRYKKECIISLNNKWFAIFNIEGKPLDYKFFTLKVLHKIFEENIYVEDLKKQNKINIVKGNNKGILYCDYSEIEKMKYIRVQ